jgi:hypothetical protein
MSLLAANINGASAVVIGVVAGLIIVAVLIGAFVLGSRRKEKEPIADQDPHSPERDSWATPISTPGHAPHGDANAPGHHIDARP